MKKIGNLKKRLFCSMLVMALMPGGVVAEPTIAELVALIKQQQQQIEVLQKQVETLTENADETRMIVESSADTIESGIDTHDHMQAAKKNFSVGGYGEHHLNIKSGEEDQVDAHRFVTYIGYEFNERLRFFSEIELEHSVAGEGENGEIELEQAFIDYRWSDHHRLVLGQFLLPIGILNETHEPETFYGVERNRVESEVIPSSWWETGVMLQGELSSGWNYDLAAHSGLNVDDDGNGNLNIRNARQKSSEAIADDFAYTARLRYAGIRGLQLATSLHYQTDLAQGSLADDAGAWLLSGHAIYQRAGFVFRALFAHWNISNDQYQASNADTLSGFFVEPSYRFSNDLGVFLRYSEYERANNVNIPISKGELFDLGANYWLTDSVVLKGDYQHDLKGDADSYNLGIGWSF